MRDDVSELERIQEQVSEALAAGERIATILIPPGHWCRLLRELSEMPIRGITRLDINGPSVLETNEIIINAPSGQRVRVVSAAGAPE